MSNSLSADESWSRKVLWGVICVIILGGGVGGTVFLINNGPEAPTADPVVKLDSVLVQQAVVEGIQLTLRSQGEVVAKRQTTLTAEVAGKLTLVHERFEPGEVFRGPAEDNQGDLLLQIDRADYEAALAAAKATLAEARLALRMEEVRKAQALRDWEKLGSGKEPNELVKRVPQLASAHAGIAASEAAVKKAARDLERTEIRVPYDCRLERTYVDVGAVIAPGMPLVDLVSRGGVEIRLPLSLEDYGYLQKTGEQVSGEVTASGRIGGEELSWKGRIVRSEEMVERTTRSINVVGEFGMDGSSVPPIGMFVDVAIKGVTLPDVVRIPRSAMIDGRKVLLVREGRLDIRPVKVVRTESEVVIVNGGSDDGEVPKGAQIVITPPNAPVQGEQVVVEDSAGNRDTGAEK